MHKLFNIKNKLNKMDFKTCDVKLAEIKKKRIKKKLDKCRFHIYLAIFNNLSDSDSSHFICSFFFLLTHPVCICQWFWYKGWQ